MARNIYRLSAEGHLWTLQVGGHVLGRWRSRDGALRRAQAIAAGDQPSLLVVHAPTGRSRSSIPSVTTRTHRADEPGYHAVRDGLRAGTRRLVPRGPDR